MKLDEYSRMLAVIPGMNDTRIHMVTSRYGSFAKLYNTFQRLESEVRSGGVALNSALFSEAGPTRGSMERWVHNLYYTLMGTDPNLKLYYDSD
ncbi:hypothetical protein AAF712_010414 [Marasmius tenuissimus]|uniref:Uncharacterized protein n=1 Tax=Marasmius tenuissimus TaxID=585030 RepID=A0ABR2ZNF4_9AGAR